MKLQCIGLATVMKSSYFSAYGAVFLICLQSSRSILLQVFFLAPCCYYFSLIISYVPLWFRHGSGAWFCFFFLWWYPVFKTLYSFQTGIQRTDRQSQ